ncbi:MAG: alcohol dehydrogenase catalytic domain-containing protein [Novosphingobium sp.]
MRGIVFDGERLRLTEALEVRAPGPGEVRVRVLRSGLCHSDLNMVKGGLIGTPVVLGHEAAGEVIELGPETSGFALGDAVLVSPQAPCGECRECHRGTPVNCDATWGMAAQQPFTWEGRPTYSFSNVSSFAGEIVVRADQLHHAGALPPEQAALIGCAVSTGYSAAKILGGIGKGDRVVVIGIGGIGVNAIAGARINGAEEILAVDLNPDKEPAARHAGATRFLAASRGMDAAALAQAIAEAGAPLDVAIECSGAPVAAAAAFDAVKRGGKVVLIGQTKPGARLDLSLDALTFGREVVGMLNSGTDPHRDYPEMIALAASGELDLASQVTRVWPLAEFEQAIAALENGEVIRAVLDHTA